MTKRIVMFALALMMGTPFGFRAPARGLSQEKMDALTVYAGTVYAAKHPEIQAEENGFSDAEEVAVEGTILGVGRRDGDTTLLKVASGENGGICYVRVSTADIAQYGTVLHRSLSAAGIADGTTYMNRPVIDSEQIRIF